MNTEHIFNIAIGIDEESIRERVYQNVEKTLITNIENAFYVKYSYNSKPRISDWLMDKLIPVIEAFLEKNREYILEHVIKAITEKFYRSKAFKEKIGELNDFL